MHEIEMCLLCIQLFTVPFFCFQCILFGCSDMLHMCLVLNAVSVC